MDINQLMTILNKRVERLELAVGTEDELAPLYARDVANVAEVIAQETSQAAVED